jgi:hypothetical protein
MAKRNKQIISLAVCALALAAGLSVKPAMAYFTSYQAASGAVEISVANPEAEISEKVSSMTKYIIITNTGDADCYIRVAAIAPEEYTLTEEESDKWTLGNDGYYYYSDPVAPQGSTTELKIMISGYEKIVEQAKNNENYLPEDFNVIILQESTKVLYDEDGTAYPNWSQAISTNQNSQEGGQ